MNKILIIFIGLIICSCETIRNDICFDNCQYVDTYCTQYKINDCKLKLQSCYNKCFEKVEQNKQAEKTN
jgi:hypothetical protein